MRCNFIFYGLFLTMVFLFCGVSFVFAKMNCPLSVGAYQSKGDSAVYFVTENCTKQTFSGPTAFLEKIKSWKKLKPTTAELLAKIPKDKKFILYPSKTSSCALASGAYQHKGGKAVYYITDKCTKQTFSGPTAFLEKMKSWKNLKLASEASLNKISKDTNYILYASTAKVAPKGCLYNAPACASGQDCVKNQCLTKKGCAYKNPPCGAGYQCGGNQCQIETSCASGYVLYKNKCVLDYKFQCLVNGYPSCQMAYMCLNNKCVLRDGCTFDNPKCSADETCVENVCVDNQTMNQNDESSQKGHCCFDDALKIGSFQQTACAGKNINLVSTNSVKECKNLTAEKKYRYAKYFYSTDDFALVCTNPCSIDSALFMEKNLVGIKKSVAKLKEMTGNVLPKGKIEYHVGRDADCFSAGYGVYPTGYTFVTGAHPLVCDSNGFYQIRSDNMYGFETFWDMSEWEDINVLAIHEPIHNIFFDYAGNGDAPDYKIQESFCKALSLYTTNDFVSGPFYSSLDISKPPAEDNTWIYDFLVYSLNKRFGFSLENAKTFFTLYKNDQTAYQSGNLKVKAILDKIVGKDTKQSFADVGMKF